jgi:6-phosphogluconate dehydrogenase
MESVTMELGIVGLGVMGRNLALNARDAGIGVVATDSWETARDWSAPGIAIVEDAAALAAALSPPRVVLLMVKAGAKVDVEIAGLMQHLAAGDIVIDGGNSHYRNTEWRAKDLEGRGIGYLGLGVSGGAEGARHGAAMMAGGSEAAWEASRDLLLPLAAKAGDGAPTLWRFGDGGAGHFVKMAHNGIEYAIMQAIAECHGLLTGVGGLAPEAVAELLGHWNAQGRAGGFLLEITAEIAATRDPLAGGYLLDHVSDAAGQKGTGTWAVQAGLDYGVPLPSIMEAVSARQISGLGAARDAMRAAADRRPLPDCPANLAPDLEAALVATMTVSLCQGLQLYAAAAAQHGWRRDLPDVLRVWRAGSILRMSLLDEIIGQLDGQGETADPLAAAGVAADVVAALPAWRRVVGAAVAAGFPVSVLAISLAYVEALGTAALPTAMIQAQRDRFGAHGFARTDRDGTHHGPWVHPDAEAGA